MVPVAKFNLFKSRGFDDSIRLDYGASRWWIGIRRFNELKTRIKTNFDGTVVIYKIERPDLP